MTRDGAGPRRPKRRQVVSGPPGLAAWSALPLRDKRLLQWLVMGGVITAEMAAVMAYGHLRVAQRRLSKLVEYGLLRGFWSANTQRPRGRYAYALTKSARTGLEEMIWDGRLEKPEKVEAPPPVIHQLATHDLLVALMRAPAADGTYLAGWAPERAASVAFSSVRPDALALFAVRDRLVAILIERDLGTERRGILRAKARSYTEWLSFHRDESVNVGFIVETPRRAAAVRQSLRWWLEEYILPGRRKIPCWVAVCSELTAMPFGAVWRAPDGQAVTVGEMESFEAPWEMPPVGPLCLLEDHGPEALDDRLLRAVGDLGRHVWS